MSDAIPPSPFSEGFNLRDGTPVLIRVAGPEDGDKFVAAFGKLEAKSIYTRFFHVKKELGPADLSRLATSDYSSSLVLVACLGSGPEEAVIGAASYAPVPRSDGIRAVEVAFTIEEDYQGQGLATKLLTSLAGIARQHGIECFEAEVLSENAAMLSVFKRCGLALKITREQGVNHLVMDLNPPGRGDQAT